MSAEVWPVAGVLLLRTAILGSVLPLAAGAAAWKWRRAAPAATRHLIWSFAIAGLVVFAAVQLGAAVLGNAGRLPHSPIQVAWLSSDGPPPVGPSVDTHGAIHLTSWLRWVPALWLIGAATVAFWLAIGRWMAGSLVRHSVPARAPALLRLAHDVSTALGLTRGPRIRIADASTIPMVWGVVRPTVLLPVEAIEWPESRLRAVLLHEMAHVRRGDGWTQALTSLALVLYWFHPVVWFMVRRLESEQEGACDDMVLRAGVPSRIYAGELIALARSSQPVGRALAIAGAATLGRRVPAILDSGRARGNPSAAVRVALWGTTAGLLALLSSAGTPVALPFDRGLAIPSLEVRRSPGEDRAVYVRSDGPRLAWLGGSDADEALRRSAADPRTPPAVRQYLRSQRGDRSRADMDHPSAQNLVLPPLELQWSSLDPRVTYTTIGDHRILLINNSVPPEAFVGWMERQHFAPAVRQYLAEYLRSRRDPRAAAPLADSPNARRSSGFGPKEEGNR